MKGLDESFLKQPLLLKFEVKVIGQESVTFSCCAKCSISSVEFQTLLVCSSKRCRPNFCGFRLKRCANDVFEGTEDLRALRFLFSEISKKNLRGGGEIRPLPLRGLSYQMQSYAILII